MKLKGSNGGLKWCVAGLHLCLHTIRPIVVLNLSAGDLEVLSTDIVVCDDGVGGDCLVHYFLSWLYVRLLGCLVARLLDCWDVLAFGYSVV